MDLQTHPKLSIVATIYNSAAIVDALVWQIKSVVETMGVTYEIILVDDGSSDDSVYVMEEQSRLDKQVKSIILSRNFGQQIAMSAGIHHAMGEYVLIMDGDLQNPPEAIFDLYNMMLEGYDIIYTTSYIKNNIFDGFTSWIFWKFLKVVMKVNIAESQLMMRIMTSRVAQYYREYPEKIRTVAAITHDIGMRYAILSVKNRRREQGESNYTNKMRINLAIDVLLDFSNRPLNFIFYSGLLLLIATMIATTYYFYAYLTKNIMPGFTTLTLLIMLFGSINLISTGILARYMANIYTEVKGRPLYFVRKTINL